MSRSFAVPLSFLVLVAAGALAGCRDRGAQPTVIATAHDSADQTIFGVRTLLTDEGLMRAELLADTAFSYEDGTRFELRKVKTTFFTKVGARDAVLTSREGTYRSRSNDMEARGNVVVVSEQGRRLETPVLRFDQTRNEISSDSAFVLTEPNRRLEGVGFVSDPNMANVRILQSKAATTGAVTLPGQ
jgi:LPS export ABC transporter protein LptC